MIFTPSELEGVFFISLQPVGDSRGWFSRTYCKNEFAAIGHDKEWVQINHSFTSQKGTIRGMHYQLPPFREIKMVRCIAGAVLDVVIDLRENSPTFLQHTQLELSAENRQMIYIPEGFAHGFQCLQDNCELIYHHSAFYTPGAEGGIMYNDPLTGIEWPLAPTEISDRDRSHPLLNKNFKGI
ncbi:dTDP-4-dehydrorhamnose 3,5-epimerase [Terrimonas sp. NA20]|uniref:dTDP-4-dehydrorhamnose 3,5-epimerase n=1 Tax=Terrimonas ginsenosidimutans TaxID=2908004 RepID=A0ABS9KSW7_9BACT|nr:dTDP-4-dehydrorhamnose 3,5-epimerase [Terrimonas ginsenosidimutans]MCG2615401.1 dTDP-4-dehydrorhamnose 3,5-epimerase [Terrimonas ginsenosidimutans]